MPAKPPITTGSDNMTPTTAVQQADENWAQPTSSGDGYHVTLGKKDDGAADDSTSAWSVVSLLKGAWAKLEAIRAAVVAGLTVSGTVTSNQGTPAVDANAWPTKLVGRNLTQAPVHGAKTVTNVAASLFAGAARLANRNYLAIYNESANTIYVGGSGVTTANGFPILPGDSKTYNIDPTQDFGIYAIAASNSAVRVEEGK